MSGSIANDALRFIGAGAVNTALTAGVYAGGQTVLTPTQAYALAWAIGLAFVMTVYPNKVFPGGHRSFKDRVALAMVTLFVFCVGIVMIRMLAPPLGPMLAFFVALPVTTVLNFALSRVIIRRARSG